MSLTTSVVTGGSAIAGPVMQYKAAGEMEKAAKEREKQAQRAKIRETRRIMRENRARRAMVANTAAQTGVSDSSLELGTQGNLQQQTGANLGTLNTEFQSQQRIFDFQQNAQDYQTKAGIANTITETGMMFMPGGQLSGAGGNIFSGAGGSK